MCSIRNTKEIEKLEGIENHEISIDYVNTEGLWNRNEIKNINEIFFYSIACNIVNRSEDPEPRSVTKCQNRYNWIKWKDVIQAELNSFNKRKVFGPIILMPEAMRPAGYK